MPYFTEHTQFSADDRLAYYPRCVVWLKISFQWIDLLGIQSVVGCSLKRHPLDLAPLGGYAARFTQFNAGQSRPRIKPAPPVKQPLPTRTTQIDKITNESAKLEKGRYLGPCFLSPYLLRCS
jgi:hypothetical protein